MCSSDLPLPHPQWVSLFSLTLGRAPPTSGSTSTPSLSRHFCLPLNTMVTILALEGSGHTRSLGCAINPPCLSAPHWTRPRSRKSSLTMVSRSPYPCSPPAWTSISFLAIIAPEHALLRLGSQRHSTNHPGTPTSPLLHHRGVLANQTPRFAIQTPLPLSLPSRLLRTPSVLPRSSHSTAPLQHRALAQSLAPELVHVCRGPRPPSIGARLFKATPLLSINPCHSISTQIKAIGHPLPLCSSPTPDRTAAPPWALPRRATGTDHLPSHHCFP